jgi:hypothetical protein
MDGRRDFSIGPSPRAQSRVQRFVSMLHRALILVLAFFAGLARGAAAEPTTHRFTLLVSDEKGAPVQSAVVRWRAAGPILGRGTSDASGHVPIAFERPTRPSWHLDVQVIAIGFAPTTATVAATVFSSTSQLDVLHVTLPRKVMISGVVLDATGKPVPRAQVDVFGSSPRIPVADGSASFISYTEELSAARFTGADGRWFMETVPANALSLTITVTDAAGHDFEFVAQRAAARDQPGAVTLASLFDGSAALRLTTPATDLPILKPNPR